MLMSAIVIQFHIILVLNFKQPIISAATNKCYISLFVLMLYIPVNNFSTVTRTSDGGNGNHRVLLPIILIKIKVDQMLPSSYISSLLVSIL